LALENKEQYRGLQKNFENNLANQEARGASLIGKQITRETRL